MKLYIVVGSDWDSTEIKGIFTDKTDAETYEETLTQYRTRITEAEAEVTVKVSNRGLVDDMKIILLGN